MAGPGVGAKGFVGFGAETTWGTAVTPKKYIEFLSESLKRNQSGVTSNGIQPYRGVTSYKKTTIAPGGDISFEVAPEGIPVLLYHALGNVVTTVSGAGYQHVIKPAISLPAGLTFHINRDIAYFDYPGSKINTFDMGFAPNEIITGSVSVSAKDETAVLAATTADPNTPSFSLAEPFTGVQATLQVAGSSQGVMAADFSISNDIFAGKYELGGNRRAALMEQKRSVTGKLNIEFDDLDMYNYFVSGTPATLRITLISDQVTSPINSMDIYFPKVTFTGETPTMGGPGIITVDCPFTALFTSPIVPEIIITVISSEATITGL